MSCYHPIAAFRCADGSVVFTQLARYDIIGDIKLPCGQCIGCRLDRAREWSLRCMHEAAMHEENTYITLTYAEENLPEGNSLNYRDFQLFMKRLRKRVNSPGLKFFMCGEYGERSGRPHFHACVFGYQFADLVAHGINGNGDQLYRSAELEKLWPYGYSVVGNVTKQSAGYVARYCLKKVTGKRAEEHYKYVDQDGVMHRREPEFARMSLKPGIGESWFRKFGRDVLPRDYCIEGGFKNPVPRYYEKLYDRQGEDLEEVKERRGAYGREHAENNTAERLIVREQVKHAAIRSLRRDII